MLRAPNQSIGAEVRSAALGSNPKREREICCSVLIPVSPPLPGNYIITLPGITRYVEMLIKSVKSFILQSVTLQSVKVNLFFSRRLNDS